KDSLKVPSSCPVVFFGDFNDILSENEEDGVVRDKSCVDGFRKALDTCSVQDLGYRGNTYKQQRGLTMDTLIRVRLDCFLACDEWCKLFPIFSKRTIMTYGSEIVSFIFKPNGYQIRGECVEKLRAWGKTTFSEVHKRIKRAKKSLESPKRAIEAKLLE
ncbi:Auxin transport protein BIG, partial [Bienertia sinuspersici]